MPRRPRILIAGGAYHIYNRGVEKRVIFNNDWDRRFFLRQLGDCARWFQTKIIAYCLMDNHFHFYLQTLLPNLDAFMQRFGSQYVRYFNKRYERVGGLFQGRYKDKIIESTAYAGTLLEYIHENPRELGHDPESYPWSSYPIYLGKAPKPGWLDIESAAMLVSQEPGS